MKAWVSAIVLAAGRGLRFESRVQKPLARINSQAVITYCLKVFAGHPDIKEIILVANKQNFGGIAKNLRQLRIAKINKLILGGRRRQDSVKNGLSVLDKRAEFILIHDGVRPFIDKKTVSRLIGSAKKLGAAIAGVPVKATIKKIKNQKQLLVEKTINRDNLWEIQTPQVFRKDLILKAYAKFGDMDATDDAMLVEKLGARVRIVPGSYHNIKITTQEDLILAKGICAGWHTG